MTGLGTGAVLRVVPVLLAGLALSGLPGTSGSAQDRGASFPYSFVPHEKELSTQPGNNLGSRIYYGNIADEGAWPWQVGLVRRADDETVFDRQFCGGSLVSSTW